MKHIGDLLADLHLPEPGTRPADEALLREPEWIHDLGAGLPAGHLHLWGGPRGAGKTAFLLSLLTGAALHGRRTVYATYHLPASSLAVRTLAMVSGVEPDALLAGGLDEAGARRAAAAREGLRGLPFHLVEARGFGVASLEDRLVRMPFRPDVLAVDYLQAVVRSPGEDVGGTVRAFASLASRLHLAAVVALQSKEAGPLAEVLPLADRAGWIAPAGGSGLRRAEVIQNRYGDRPAIGFRLDRASGALERLDLPLAPG